MDSEWKLERFYHTVINASDIDQTVLFYEALGFELIRDRRRVTKAAGVGVVFGLTPDVTMRGALMALPSDPPPDGPMLDIIQWIEPQATFAGVPPPSVPRITAFRTRNVGGVIRAMRAKGYRTTTAEAFTAIAASGIRAMGGVYDPDGNLVELIDLEPGLVTSKLTDG